MVASKQGNLAWFFKRNILLLVLLKDKTAILMLHNEWSANSFGPVLDELSPFFYVNFSYDAPMHQLFDRVLKHLLNTSAYFEVMKKFWLSLLWFFSSHILRALFLKGKRLHSGLQISSVQCTLLSPDVVRPTNHSAVQLGWMNLK